MRRSAKPFEPVHPPARPPGRPIGRRVVVAMPVLAAAMLGDPAATSAQPTGWAALRQPGRHALMRHADAPGTGDPPGFVLGDCATQRNLDANGRRQARLIGQTTRDQRIPIARVLSSQWCRCTETARLLDLGTVEIAPALNSFFDSRAEQAAQTAQALALLMAARPDETLVLVSHQVNITALTGIFPASGEIIVVSLDRARGTLAAEARIRV